MSNETINTCHSICIAGTDVTFACASGENLLRTALSAGIGIPYECNAGGCGSCKIELLSGEVEDLWPEAPGIRPKDKERRRRLACQSSPLSDCEIKVHPANEFVPPVKPRRFEAKYQSSVYVTPDIREFCFASSGPADFLPGQYAMLRLSGMRELRAYSMSNQPNHSGEWKFMIRNVPGGNISGKFFDSLTPGAAVELDGPYGIAHLRPEEQTRDIVCIAGGSGLAPMVSILNGATSHEGLAELDIWMFYGGRGPQDIPKFEDFVHLHPNVCFHSAISVPALAEGTDYEGEVCMVHELLPRKLTKPPAAYEYYLAGPPPMIEAVVRLLIVDQKVPPAQIHYDRFF